MVKLPAANSVAGKARARNLSIAEAGKAAGLSSNQIAQQQQRTASTTPTTPTTPTNPVLPTQTVTPPVEPTPTAPVAPTTTVLPISKESDVYKQLTAKGYDDAKILDLYNQAKAKQTPEARAITEKQEPKAKSTAVDPIAEPATPATPAVNVNVNNAPATEPAKPPKTDQGPLTPLSLKEYQDNSTVRQNEIVNNLNGYRQSNPEFLTNLDTFRKTFSYGLRSDDQKQLLDNWYLGYQKGVKLGNMGTTSIVDQYTSGNITSSDLEQLRLNNPAKYQEAMDAINKKDIVRTYQNELYETDKQKTIMAQLDEASGQGDIFEEYKKTINSDEVKALQSEIQDMETQREQLSLELNDIKDQVEKRYEGTGATKGKIAYIVAKESAALQKQITSIGIDSANRVDKYNSIVNTAKETMQLQLQEQEAERAARNQKMSELGFYYQYDPVGMAERAENIFNIENPDINSPDANTARRALNNELTKYYEKYGDIIIRPQSQALNDILAQAKADGTSLSAALKKNFTDQLQSKSLYGQMLVKNIGIDMGNYNIKQGADGNWNISQKQTAGKVVNINGIDYMQDAQGNLSIPNTPMSRSDVKSSLSSIVSATGSADMGTIATAIQNNYQDGVYGGQCGEFVNDIASSIGSSVHFGNTLKEKESKITTQQPSVGSFVVMDTGVAGGHVGMVTGINQDGTITIKDSNRGSNEKVQTHTLSKAQMAKVKGYVTPTVDTSKVSSGQIDTTTAFSLLSFPTAVKSDQEQKNIKDLVASGNIPAVKSKLINLAVNNIEGAESKKDFQSTYTMIGTLDKIQGLLDKAETLGVPTGWLSGKSEDLVNKFGKSNNPEIVRLGTALKDQLDALRRGRSGAALTEFEEQFYDSIFPSAGKKYNLNTANINGLKDSRNMLFKTYLENAYTSEIAEQLLGTQTTTTTSTITNPFTQGYKIPAIGGVVSSFYK